MREYIRKSSGVPKTVHMRVKALLKDYQRMCSMKNDLLYGSMAPLDGMPRGVTSGNPTAQKAIKLAALSREITAIDQTCMLMRGEYSGKTYEDFDPLKAYWSYDYYNYQHIRTTQQTHGPSTRTWHRYKDKFTMIIAKKLNFL